MDFITYFLAHIYSMMHKRIYFISVKYCLSTLLALLRSILVQCNLSLKVHLVATLAGQIAFFSGYKLQVIVAATAAASTETNWVTHSAINSLADKDY